MVTGSKESGVGGPLAGALRGASELAAYASILKGCVGFLDARKKGGPDLPGRLRGAIWSRRTRTRTMS
jgi:hypothetical protein